MAERAISVLLVSNCTQSLSVLSDVLEKYGIKRVVCKTGLAGFEAIRKMRFDLLVLDLDCAGTASLLDLNNGKFQIGRTPVIALNLTEGRLTEEQRKRIRCTLQKPLTPDLIVRTLKLVYRTIAIEKRVSFRCTEEVATFDAYYRENNVRHPLPGAVILDISSTGFCLKTGRQIPKDATVFVNFRIPGDSKIVHAVGNVAWSDVDGRAGAEFRFVPSDEFTHLRDWLDRQNPWARELTPRPISSLALPEQTLEIR